MSELREEIERQFAAFGLIEPPVAIDASATKMSSAPFSEDETIAVENIEAPASFDEKFAADFKNLPPEWQHFLSAHEAKINQSIDEYVNKLQSYAWVDRVFAEHKERLHQQGFEKMERWLEGLAAIDACMQQKPAETLNAIAICYGVKPVAKSAGAASSSITQEVIGRLCDLERDYHDLKEHMQREQYQRLVDLVTMFGNQTDVNGRPLHPYFNEVKQQVFNLLQTGTVSDVSEAYEQALWLHPAVREELIKQKISSAAIDAQKAKQASFAPKGKAEAPEKELTLREEIAKNMAAFMD